MNHYDFMVCTNTVYISYCPRRVIVSYSIPNAAPKVLSTQHDSFKYKDRFPSILL